MTTKEKSTTVPAQKSWKVRPDTLKRVNQECLNRDLTQAALAEVALDSLATDQSSPFLKVPSQERTILPTSAIWALGYSFFRFARVTILAR